MAFRVDGLGTAYAQAQAEATRLRSYAVSAQAAMAAGNISANAVIQTLTTMKNSIEVFDYISGLSGMAQYARDQQDDQAYDVVAEFQSMRTEAVGARDWVFTNFPTAVSGEIIKDTLENDGAITVRQFTPAQTAGLQSALGLLIATIDTV
jgi:hypothetical protein